MAHTPLIRMLHRAAAEARQASKENLEPDQVIDQRLARTSRREFIGSLALGSAGVLSSRAAFAGKPSGSTSRVVVVGAGLAGLTCGYRLKQAGINATIYDAASRLGGRCWTRRSDFTQGQIAEHGGELID